MSKTLKNESDCSEIQEWIVKKRQNQTIPPELLKKFESESFLNALHQSDELYKTFYNKTIYINLHTDGLVGHVSGDLPVLSDDGKTITLHQNIGLDPAPDAPLFKKIIGTQGYINSQIRSEEKNRLLKVAVHISEERYEQLAHLMREAIDKPPPYNVMGFNGHNCIQWMHGLLQSINITDGLNNKFSYSDINQLDSKPILTQARPFTEEFNNELLQTYTADMVDELATTLQTKLQETRRNKMQEYNDSRIKKDLLFFLEKSQPSEQQPTPDASSIEQEPNVDFEPNDSLTQFALDATELDCLINDSALYTLSPEEPTPTKAQESPSIGNPLKITHVSLGTVHNNHMGIVASLENGSSIGIGLHARTGSSSTLTFNLISPLTTSALASSMAVVAPITALIVTISWMYNKRLKRIEKHLQHDLEQTRNNMESINNSLQLCINDFQDELIDTKDFITKLNATNALITSEQTGLLNRAHYALKKKKYENVYHYFKKIFVMQQTLLDNTHRMDNNNLLEETRAQLSSQQNHSLINLISYLEQITNKPTLSPADFYEARELKNLLINKLLLNNVLLSKDNLLKLQALSLKSPSALTSVALPPMPGSACFRTTKEEHTAETCINSLHQKYNRLKNLIEKKESCIEEERSLFVESVSLSMNTLKQIKLKGKGNDCKSYFASFMERLTSEVEANASTTPLFSADEIKKIKQHNYTLTVHGYNKITLRFFNPVISSTLHVMQDRISRWEERSIYYKGSKAVELMAGANQFFPSVLPNLCCLPIALIQNNSSNWGKYFNENTHNQLVQYTQPMTYLVKATDIAYLISKLPFAFKNEQAMNILNGIAKLTAFSTFIYSCYDTYKTRKMNPLWVRNTVDSAFKLLEYSKSPLPKRSKDFSFFDHAKKKLADKGWLQLGTLPTSREYYLFKDWLQSLLAVGLALTQKEESSSQNTNLLISLYNACSGVYTERSYEALMANATYHRAHNNFEALENSVSQLRSDLTKYHGAFSQQDDSIIVTKARCFLIEIERVLLEQPGYSKSVGIG
ncbi:hypothetical protein ACD661_11250 [Legionella lytica]|uniref:Uncharacterized protein n=1 Tax=Legionella lytica TaxID=96232 RepID=A0ABW8D8U5_9GAMM